MFLITQFRSLGGVLELGVLKYTHFVLFAFGESLLATSPIIDITEFVVSFIEKRLGCFATDENTRIIRERQTGSVFQAIREVIDVNNKWPRIEP